MANMSMTEQIESALNAVTVNFSPNSGQVSTLRRLSGGASQEIWAFELSSPSAPTKRFILRRAPGGVTPEASGHSLSLTTEAQILQAVQQDGLNVPDVHYICTPQDGLGAGYIMSFVEGETIARKIQRDQAFAPARETFATDCGAALAAIHQTPLQTLPADLPVSSGLDQIMRYEEIYRHLDIPRPTFDLAFQVLKETAPANSETVLVHGDFRLGNLMLNETGLTAVLDWELAHLGDAREDIGWICVNSWRFGAADKRVGGIDQLQPLLDAYMAAGGARIQSNDIDWWEMLGTLKWGIMCMIMYDTYRTGGDVSVERAAIGRRVSETEIDLINLLESL